MRRTAARPEPPAWLIAIRRAKAAAWNAMTTAERARSLEALRAWREKRERERRGRDRK
jgi:hypothetical protein